MYNVHIGYYVENVWLKARPKGTVTLRILKFNIYKLYISLNTTHIQCPMTSNFIQTENKQWEEAVEKVFKNLMS